MAHPSCIATAGDRHNASALRCTTRCSMNGSEIRASERNQWIADTGSTPAPEPQTQSPTIIAGPRRHRHIASGFVASPQRMPGFVHRLRGRTVVNVIDRAPPMVTVCSTRAASRWWSGDSGRPRAAIPAKTDAHACFPDRERRSTNHLTYEFRLRRAGMGFKPVCALRAPCTNYSRDKFELTSSLNARDNAGTRDFGSIERVAISARAAPAHHAAGAGMAACASRCRYELRPTRGSGNCG